MMTIDGNKLRWLFWLRWKTLTRTNKKTSQLVATIILMIFIVGIGITVAAATFLAYRFVPAPANAEILYIVLTGLFLLWIILPLMEFTTNEGLDISKLALFPLTRGEIMASLLASTLLDIPTIGLVLTLVAVVAGWASSIPLALMTLLVVLVFYVQLVAVSQLVLALLQGVLQSRRFRDLSIIFVVLLSSSGYLCQLAARGFINKGSYNALMQGKISAYLQWLPSGMAAHAIQLASVGNWGLSFVWLIVLAVISVAFLYLWQMVVERGLTAESSGGSVKRRGHKSGQQGQQPAVMPAGNSTVAASAGSAGLLARFIPASVRAIMQKELKYYWRDPQLKALLLQSMVAIIFLIVYLGYTLFSSIGASNGVAIGFIGHWIVPFTPLVLLLFLYSLSYNTLGMERQSITTLFLFPIPPKHILWGKNLAAFVVGFTVQLVLILVATIITRTWINIIPALVVGLAGLAIMLGIGNFTSVFFPQKMRRAGRGFQTGSNLSAQGGCLRSLMSMLAFYGMIIIMVPVIAAVLLPMIFQVQWVWAISLPASLVYGGLIYIVVTNLVAPRILRKEPEIVEVLAKE